MLPNVYGYCMAPNSNPPKANFEYRQPSRYQWSKVKSTPGGNTWVGYGYGLTRSYVTTGVHHTEYKIQKFGGYKEIEGLLTEKIFVGHLAPQSLGFLIPSIPPALHFCNRNRHLSATFSSQITMQKKCGQPTTVYYDDLLICIILITYLTTYYIYTIDR